METTTLSEVALALFRPHVERKGQIAVDDSTREPYTLSGKFMPFG